jgi:hypothetical protein
MHISIRPRDPREARPDPHPNRRTEPMSIFAWIAVMIVCAKLADGASELMKARAGRISRGGGDSQELDHLREEMRALGDRVEAAERAALSADEKVRFMERLLAAPAASPAFAAPAQAPRSPDASPPM